MAGKSLPQREVRRMCYKLRLSWASLLTLVNAVLLQTTFASRDAVATEVVAPSIVAGQLVTDSRKIPELIIKFITSLSGPQTADTITDQLNRFDSLFLNREVFVILINSFSSAQDISYVYVRTQNVSCDVEARTLLSPVSERSIQRQQPIRLTLPPFTISVVAIDGEGLPRGSCFAVGLFDGGGASGTRPELLLASTILSVPVAADKEQRNGNTPWWRLDNPTGRAVMHVPIPSPRNQETVPLEKRTMLFVVPPRKPTQARNAQEPEMGIVDQVVQFLGMSERSRR